MNLKNIIQETNTKELLRAYHSNKEYLYFDISVFNVGASIFIICTDNYIEIKEDTWNGYNFIIENEKEVNDMIYDVLKEIHEGKHPNKIVTTYQEKRINKIFN